MELGLIIAILVIAWYGYRLLDRERFAHLPITAGLNTEQKKTLEKHFRFYVALPPKSQKIFEYRVAKFIRMKQFVPRQMEVVTDEMKVLIAASAIQLTFGFPRVSLSYFKYILVYPEQFLSNSSNRYHKGEVNPGAKAIVLSWKHFVEGYTLPEGINLGLHEMAHALQLENRVINKEYGFLHPEAVDAWQKLAEKEMEKIRKGEETIFRKYGGTDHHEFFAVAVEYFFECPQVFCDYSRDLYEAMCKLLRQNPLLLYQQL